MKLTLIQSDHRQTGNVEPVEIVYKVYLGEHLPALPPAFRPPTISNEVESQESPTRKARRNV